MENEDRATRALLVIVCMLAIGPLVIAALVEIAVHELRCVYDAWRSRSAIVARNLAELVGFPFGAIMARISFILIKTGSLMSRDHHDRRAG